MRKLITILALVVLVLSARKSQAEYWAPHATTRDTTNFVGQVELVEAAMLVKVNPWYLDCEHTFEVAVETNQVPNQDKDSLCIMGIFELPKSSVIVGGQLWDGDVMVRARLIALEAGSVSTGADTLGRLIHPTMKIEKLISNALTDQYRLTLFPVRWGWNRKFRIRYLVPQRETDGRITMPFMPTLNMTFSRAPATIRMELQGSQQIDSASLQYLGIDDFCKLPVIRNIPLTMSNFYRSELEYSISVNATKPSNAVATQFSQQSAYSGNYLLYWGNVPQQLNSFAPQKVEVLFIWKWFDEKGYVTISPDGQRFIANGELFGQANALKNAVLDVGYGGAKVGLIHDRDSTNNDKQYPLSYRGSLQFGAMVSYLQRNTNQSVLLASIKGVEPGYGEYPTEGQLSKIAQKGAEEFTLCMQKAFTMFTPGDNTVRHIVVVTTGASNNMSGHMSFYKNPGFSNVTINCAAAWNGVPVTTINEQYALLSSQYTGGFPVPVIKNYNYILTVGSGTIQKKIELIPYYQTGDYGNPKNIASIPTCFLAGRSTTQWVPTFRWDMYEKNGKHLGSFVDTITPAQTANDTALVKIWAGSNEPISESLDPTRLGGIYGIVDWYSFINTRFGDTVSSANATQANKTTPYFSDAEISKSGQSTVHDKIYPTYKTTHATLTFHQRTLVITLMSPVLNSNFEVKIINLKGVTVYSGVIRFNDPASTQTGLRLAIPLQRETAGMYICTVSGKAFSIKKTFSIL